MRLTTIVHQCLLSYGIAFKDYMETWNYQSYCYMRFLYHIAPDEVKRAIYNYHELRGEWFAFLSD